jgi:HPt (histidine-containing phosphotransfer) domain-containing protein
MGRAIADDPDELSRSAHALTGCLGMFAGDEAVALAADLEEAGRSRDLEAAHVTLFRLKQAIAGMQPTLDQLALADRVATVSG